jgi:formylglycine-generating enzyme required for sulfatase activity
MSIRTFAAALGISERMVSKWEAGGESIHPRPVNQHALDSFLAASSADVHSRFSTLMGTAQLTRGPKVEFPGPAGPPLAERQHHVRHPVDGKLMALVEDGEFLWGENNEPISLQAFYMDIFPTTNDDYARFVRATGHTAPQHWIGERSPGQELSDHPVVFVSWHDATAYAT